MNEIGVGLSTMALAGAGVGVGNVIGAIINAIASNPNLKGELITYAILGIAIVESMGLIGLMIGMIILIG